MRYIANWCCIKPLKVRNVKGVKRVHVRSNKKDR